jgi:hypothetical protein
MNTDVKRAELAEFLTKVGADDKPHKRGSLASHLLGTYDLLKLMGQSDEVCLAGGAHSLFGTSIFKDACLDKKDMMMFIKFLGKDAAKLVHIFSITDRPHTLNNALENKITILSKTSGGTLEVSEKELHELCAIEAANLYEQNDMVPGKYPHLKVFWLSKHNKQ